MESRKGLLKDVAAACLDAGRRVPRIFRDRRAARGLGLRRVTEGDLERTVFCFGGEFGYELLSWVPFLNHVAHELGVPLRTASRPGSQPFYPFSSEHFEIPFEWRPDRFGSAASDRAFKEAFGASAVPATNPKGDNTAGLAICGIEWEHRFIHRRLVTVNHRPVQFSAGTASFVPERTPIAVINNKDFDNWGNTDPLLRESFTVRDLEDLKQVLRSRGYFVVYHRFDEPVPEERFALEDEELFEEDGCLDMRQVYSREPDPNARTLLQLELYRSADLAVCPQGGNSFLPIMSGVPTVVLTKSPRLVEYQDLERIHNTRVDVHTSARTLIAALRHDPAFSPPEGKA